MSDIRIVVTTRRWPADMPHVSGVSGKVHHDGGLVTDDPGVVSGRYLDDRARSELAFLAIVHLKSDAARHDQLDVMDLARPIT